jgi:MFS family permease
MPLFGKLGDVWGHRRVYLIGFAGFTIGAALTALAWNGPALIAVRVLGSIPGAATGPTSMALIMRAFPEEDRVKAMGWWSLVGAGAPVIGLVAGGPIVDAVGWRWIFVAQAPLSLVALVVAFLVLHETPRREREPIDVGGAVTLALATVGALLGLTLGSHLGFLHPVVLALFASSPLFLWWFVRFERTAPHPLLPLEFFAIRDFRASLVAQFGSNFTYMGGFIVTPLLLENRFGFSVAATSLAMVCRPLSNSTAAPIAGYVAGRVGNRRTAIVGCALVALAPAVFAVAAGSDSLALCFVALVISGVGLGGSSPSLITVVANSVPAHDLGVANAAQQMVAQIGTTAGIQVLSTIQGGSSARGPFVWAYLAGAAVGAIGIVAATRLPRRRATVLRIADADAA